MPSPNISFGENLPFKNDGLTASRSRFLRALNLFPGETNDSDPESAADSEGEGQGSRAEPWLRESQEMLVMDGIDLPEFEDLDELPTLDSVEVPGDSATDEVPDDPDQLWFDESVTTLFMEDADKPVIETALVKPITQTAAWPIGARAEEISPVIALGEADVEAEEETDTEAEEETDVEAEEETDVEAEEETDVEAEEETDVEAEEETDVEAEEESDVEAEEETDVEAEAETEASPNPLDDVPPPPVIPPFAGMGKPIVPVAGGHRDAGIKLAPGWKPLRGNTAKPAESTGSDTKDEEKVAATLRPPRQDSILDGFGQFLEDTVVLNAAIDGPDFKALAPPFDTPEESTAPSAKMSLAEPPAAKEDAASLSGGGDSAEPPQPLPEAPANLMAAPPPVKPEWLSGAGVDSDLPAAASQAEDDPLDVESADPVVDAVVEEDLESTWAQDSSTVDSDDTSDLAAGTTLEAPMEDEAGTEEMEPGGVDQVAAETSLQSAHASKMPAASDDETLVPEVIDLSTKVPPSALAEALPSAGEETPEADPSDGGPSQGSQPIPAPSLVEKTQLRGFDASLLYGTPSGSSFFDDLEKTPVADAETPSSESGEPEETVPPQEDLDEPAASPLPSAPLLKSEPEIKEEPVTESANESNEEVELEAKESIDSNYMASLMPQGDRDSERSSDSLFKTPFSDLAGAAEATAEEATVDEATVDEAMVDEAMVDEAMVEEAMVDEAVVDEAVADEAVADEAVVDDAMVDEAMVDEAMVDEAVADVDSGDAIPRPDDGIPVSALGYAFSKVNPAVLPHGVRCPACGVDLQIQERYLGIEGKCPACAEMIIARKKEALEPIAELADGRAPRYARQPELEPIDVPGGTTLAGKAPLDSEDSPDWSAEADTPSGDPFSNPNSALRKAREAAARGVWGPSSSKGLS